MGAAAVGNDKGRGDAQGVASSTAGRVGGAAASVMLLLSSGMAVQVVGFMSGFPINTVLLFAGMLWIAAGAAEIGRVFRSNRWPLALMAGAMFGVAAYAVDWIGLCWFVTRLLHVDANVAFAWLSSLLTQSAVFLTVASAVVCSIAARRRGAQVETNWDAVRRVAEK